MIIETRDSFKALNKTVPKYSKGAVKGVSNSRAIFNEFRGGDSDGHWFYLVEFDGIGEVAVFVSDANIV